MYRKKQSQHMRIAEKLHQVVFLMQKAANHALEEELDISFVQLMMLGFITRHPTTAQRDVANCVNVTPGAVSRQIELLREKGLLTRKVRKDNRREHEISITEKGIKTMEKAFKHIDTMLAAVFADVTKEEKLVFEKGAEKLLEVLERAERP